VARVLTLLFGVVLFAVIALAIAQTRMTTQDDLAPEIQAIIAGYGEQVQRGAEVYDLVCSNCHGNTGLGIEEGRAEFLPEHQKCEKCHRPNNAPTLANVKISEKNSFNIGEPPPLTALAKFGNAAGLKAYIQAAMPRHKPGQLSDEEYLDITAFLIALDRKLPHNTVLTAENLTAILLTD
jgi:cytochrome c